MLAQHSYFPPIMRGITTRDQNHLSSAPHDSLYLVEKSSCYNMIGRHQERVKQHYKFCCDECSFEIGFGCAATIIDSHVGREYFKHFFHYQTLTLMTATNQEWMCKLCRKNISGPTYGCATCEFFYVHKSCCEFPQVILHPFHQLHHLEVLYKKPLNSKELCYCVACGFNIDEGIRYECRKREFCLHPECGSLTANIKFHGHEHLLALIDINMCSQRTKWECNACGWEIEDDPILRCVECKYNSHISCLAVSPPETTM